MKKYLNISLFLVVIISVSSCNKNKVKINDWDNSFDDFPVIAQIVEDNQGNKVMECDFGAVDGNRFYNVDNLVESFEIIQLDSSTDEAYIEPWDVNISDNYIGAKTLRGYKLFTRDGKFINNIGRRGQGPDEYPDAVYDAFIDEPNNSIYLLGMGNVDFISQYDLSGSFVRRIPLAYRVHKGRMRVKDDKIRVINMKWDNEESPAIWEQDMEGNVIFSIDTDVTSIVPDFSNELHSYFAGDDGTMSFHLSKIYSEEDYMYHLSDSGVLSPVFTLNFGNMENIPIHTYTEFPRHFLTTLYGIENVDAYSLLYLPNSHLIVDKETGKGSLVNFVIGSMGGLFFKGYLTGCKDYLVYHLEPGDLIDLIDESIDAQENITPENKAKLEDLKSTIDVEGNNIIILGKLK